MKAVSKTSQDGSNFCVLMSLTWLLFGNVDPSLVRASVILTSFGVFLSDSAVKCYLYGSSEFGVLKCSLILVTLAGQSNIGISIGNFYFICLLLLKELNSGLILILVTS